jgi:DNA repair protein RecO (recombination protein O)
MAALHDGDWQAAEFSTSAHRSHASGLVAAHLQWHLERRLRTLPLVERVQRAAVKSEAGADTDTDADAAAEAEAALKATGSDG